MECNGNSYVLKTDIIVPPTYLKELFIDEDNIVLVCDKRDILNEKGSPIGNIRKEDVSNNSAGDLTGDPLKVDLGGDESLGSYVHSEKPNHWSAEESSHFPLNLKIARAYLNKENSLKKCEGENPNSIYVVCDGKDIFRTVLIGAQKCDKVIMTTLINVVGCYSKDHELISLEAMEKDHIKNTRDKKPSIDYLVKFKYFLYGNVLQTFKSSVTHSEHHGSVSVEVTCNRCVFNVPQNPSNMKMVLQIVAGHRLSSVHFLWEELILLQLYLDILSDSDKCNDEFTVISNTPLEESDIYKSINNIIATNLLKREAKSKFDLKHIRHEQILDKLWNLLKSSENLAVLRDSLHYFFEELVEVETNIKIPENDKSNIATLINGILNGKLAVPTLTFSQALECLFELGAEKLKNDYQTILKNFYPSSEQTVSFKWSKFINEEFTPQGGYRKTRITVNLKSGVMDLNHNISKLAYLGKLHVATELIFLIKDLENFSEETFDYFCERVYKNYVDCQTAPHDFADLQNSPLCEFSIILNSADTNIIERDTPAAWAMQMTSKVRNMEITTVYHLSKYLIIPTVIYNNYDISAITGADENQAVYYVSKLIRHKEFL